MALIIQTTADESCDGLVFYDITGLYNAVSRPGGYGTPNPDFSEVIPYTVAVTLPGGTAPAYTLNLLASPPAPVVICNCEGENVSTYAWTITPTNLGLSEITPGIYTLAWSAGDTDGVIGGIPQTGVLYLLAVHELEADINDLILQAFQGCDEDAQDRALDMLAKLCAAQKMAGCGNRTKAQTMIDALVAELSQCC